MGKFKKIKTRAFSFVLAMVLCVQGFMSGGVTAFADSQRIVTLGADLSEEQRKTVLDFFGISEDNLKTMEVVTVTNEDERAILSGIAPESAIGHKTYSCAYIEPTMSGGINVKTANLNYVTVSSLYNALQTAGVENCNLIVTAPFEVSGTGALTGVFKAFEATGEALDREKQEVAAEELLLGSKIESEHGEKGIEMVSNLKESVISSDKQLTEEEIRVLIEEECKNQGINLSDDDIEALRGLLSKLKGLGYSVDAFSKKLDELSEKVDDINPEGIWGSIKSFFRSIYEFFVDLFGFGDSEGADDTDKAEDENSDQSIFDNVDTGIFDYDEEGTEEDVGTSDSDGSDVSDENEGIPSSDAEEGSDDLEEDPDEESSDFEEGQDGGFDETDSEDDSAYVEGKEN